MGYSRAVRAGQHIAVTGTVGINAERDLLPVPRRTDPAIAPDHRGRRRSARRADARRDSHPDVRHRRQQVGGSPRVHGEVFAVIRPATSIVEVPRLIDKDAQIEIEADAIVS